MNKGSISRRNFDINLVKYNKYGTTKEHGNKKFIFENIQQKSENNIVNYKS